MNSTQKKILLLLMSGLALSLSYNPRRHWRIIKETKKEWQRIGEDELRKEINNLYRSRVVKAKDNSDGTCTIILTERGRLKSLTYKLSEMSIQKKEWDGKWRVVIFDIPEKIREGRDAIRQKLKNLGFVELQKSVFVYPYECKNEIDFVIEFFGLRKYVRYGVMESIDNAPHLQHLFHLSSKQFS